MSWECGYCGEDREEVLDVVCHHCGELVCREHQYWLWDRAFGGRRSMAGAVAAHCARCRREHHPRTVSVVGLLRW